MPSALHALRICSHAALWGLLLCAGYAARVLAGRAVCPLNGSIIPASTPIATMAIYLTLTAVPPPTRPLAAVAGRHDGVRRRQQHPRPGGAPAEGDAGACPTEHCARHLRHPGAQQFVQWDSFIMWRSLLGRAGVARGGSLVFGCHAHASRPLLRGTCLCLTARHKGVPAILLYHEALPRLMCCSMLPC